jgi:hypothetical protein
MSKFIIIIDELLGLSRVNWLHFKKFSAIMMVRLYYCLVSIYLDDRGL